VVLMWSAGAVGCMAICKRCKQLARVGCLFLLLTLLIAASNPDRNPPGSQLLTLCAWGLDFQQHPSNLDLLSTNPTPFHPHLYSWPRYLSRA
jgi:hypothetical protein